jgi:hypothetical protein
MYDSEGHVLAGGYANSYNETEQYYFDLEAGTYYFSVMAGNSKTVSYSFKTSFK